MLNEIFNKISNYKKEILLTLIVFLLCLLSFGGGILTRHYLEKPSLIIETQQ